MALLTAALLAVGDLRTKKLRNAWTVPFAVAAMLHVLIALIDSPDASTMFTDVLLSLGVNFGVHLVMGSAGWIGFGDVKFVVGLTLVAAVLVGRASMLLPLTAPLVAAVDHAVSPHQQYRSRPHGPALACAFTLVLSGAWSAWST